MDESIIAKTGLAEVIWSATFLNLTSLPPVTDIDVSVPLLKVTYLALISLAKLWHPSLSKRIPLLDRVVREGVMYAMLYSGDKLRVVQVELESLDLLIKDMGIYFVKHLKVVSI
jgi:Tti2 family